MRLPTSAAGWVCGHTGTGQPEPRRATRPPPGQLRRRPGRPPPPQIPTRPAQEVNRDHHRRTSRRGHRRGRFPGAVTRPVGPDRDDAPKSRQPTSRPRAEPADEDQALPVEADLAGETAVALTQASSTDAEPGDAPRWPRRRRLYRQPSGDDTGDDTGGDPAGVELTADDPDRILHVDPAEMTVCPSAPPSPPGAACRPALSGSPVRSSSVTSLSCRRPPTSSALGKPRGPVNGRNRRPRGVPPETAPTSATDPVGGIRSSVRVVVGTGGHRARRGVPPRRP